jgi:hypothetical protein
LVNKKRRQKEEGKGSNHPNPISKEGYDNNAEIEFLHWTQKEGANFYEHLRLTY